MRTVFKLVDRLNHMAILIINLVLIFLGLVFNRFYPVELFPLKCVLLLGILNSLTLAAVHYKSNVIDNYLNNHKDPVLKAEDDKMKRRVYSWFTLIISLAIGVFFVVVSIKLQFAEQNITGLFSLFVLFITIVISIIGYCLYVYILRYLNSIKNSHVDDFSKFYPAYSKWLLDITKYSSLYQNIFFISGFFYVALFTIHAPDETVQILISKSLNTNEEIILSSAWTIILIAVIIGFPLTSLLRGYIIRSIVTKLKLQSSQYYEKIVLSVSVEKQIDYIKVIKEIIDSPDYPTKTRTTIAISTLTTILNLLIAVMKISPQIVPPF